MAVNDKAAAKNAVPEEKMTLQAQGPPDAALNTGGTRPFSRDSAAITCAGFLETTASRSLLAIALAGLFLSAAAAQGVTEPQDQAKQDRARQEKQDSRARAPEAPGPPSDPELAALLKQNAILGERITLISRQQQIENLDHPDPLASQTERLTQRIRLLNQEQSLARLAPRTTTNDIPDHRNEAEIESLRMAYNSLAGIAPDVAKALACGGKNVVLYGPAQSEALLSVRAYNDQIELLRARLKSILDLRAPSAPDQPSTPALPAAVVAPPSNANTSVYGVAALSGPVLQSVLDLIALFQTNTVGPTDVPADESALMAVVANAASVQGCFVYWPDQYVSNPFNPVSQVTSSLQALADLNDNSGASGKPAGLHQRVGILKIELKRAEIMSQNLSGKVAAAQTRLTEAATKVDILRQQIDFISSHVKEDKGSELQEKINRSFEKAWEELESAIHKQAVASSASLEDFSRNGDLSRRMELLKTRADWLAQYVRDGQESVLGDKLRRALAADWDQLETAVRAWQNLSAATPQTIETDQNEQRRWDRYSTDLRELISTTTAASEAYSTFRGALLDGSSGTSPLSRMLRAEALRDLTFDEKFQEREGSSVVQLKLQKITGTRTIPAAARTSEKETFSGGVVMSFVQYEPNGKLKNSGVYTAYAAPASHQKETRAPSIAEDKE